MLSKKNMATNLLLGNLQASAVTELYADTNLLDSTAYMGQYDLAQVERLRRETQNEQTQEANNVPEAKRAPPKDIHREGGLHPDHRSFYCSYGEQFKCCLCVRGREDHAGYGIFLLVTLLEQVLS